MEFGVFLNGYIPGPAAHQTRARAQRAHARGGVRDLRRQAQLEVRLVRRAPRAHRVQPHVGARGRDGLDRGADRLHPPVDGHQLAVAPQGAPGALRRARRDARPLHQQPLRVGHRSRRRQPRGRQLQHHGPRPRPRPSGKRSSRRSRACGSRSTTRTRASTSPCPRRTTSSPSRTARVTRRSGSRAATRPRSTVPASSASVPSRSTSSRSSTCGAASTRTRKASPTAPSPSASSRTTT